MECASSLLSPNASPIDAHGHNIGGHAAHDPEGDFEQLPAAKLEQDGSSDVEGQPKFTIDDSAMAQVIGVAILEFGVVLHRQVILSFLKLLGFLISNSVLIGLTLAVDPNFITLFVVIIFHRRISPLSVECVSNQIPRDIRRTWYRFSASFHASPSPI